MGCHCHALTPATWVATKLAVRRRLPLPALAPPAPGCCCAPLAACCGAALSGAPPASAWAGAPGCCHRPRRLSADRHRGGRCRAAAAPRRQGGSALVGGAAAAVQAALASCQGLASAWPAAPTAADRVGRRMVSSRAQVARQQAGVQRHKQQTRAPCFHAWLAKSPRLLPGHYNKTVSNWTLSEAHWRASVHRSRGAALCATNSAAAATTAAACNATQCNARQLHAAQAAGFAAGRGSQRGGCEAARRPPICRHSIPAIGQAARRAPLPSLPLRRSLAGWRRAQHLDLRCAAAAHPAALRRCGRRS